MGFFEVESALRRFGALAMSDAALRARLCDIQNPVLFAAAVSENAAPLGLSIAAEDASKFLNASPPGAERFAGGMVTGRALPPDSWLPVMIYATDQGLAVDWAWFGTRALREPFLEDSIQSALRSPFARLTRYRMTLDDFLAQAPARQSLSPSGFIFHMSRCGSTLVAQMLAALPQNVVISEAAPVDTIVRLSRYRPDVPIEQHARALAAVLGAYGRRRAGNERHYFLKLDSSHILALPLFRHAFPDVPWVFLYRAPLEVLVSQAREPGLQMAPDMTSPAFQEMEDRDAGASEDYYARVLKHICAAAVEHHAAGGGQVVNYRDLPEALFSKILPHFGVAFTAADCDVMRQSARRDAKTPGREFMADSAAKQREATAQLRALAQQHLGAVYRDLEALSEGRQAIATFGTASSSTTKPSLP